VIPVVVDGDDLLGSSSTSTTTGSLSPKWLSEVLMPSWWVYIAQ